jgi:hypothetical protein
MPSFEIMDKMKLNNPIMKIKTRQNMRTCQFRFKVGIQQTFYEKLKTLLRRVSYLLRRVSYLLRRMSYLLRRVSYLLRRVFYLL